MSCRYVCSLTSIPSMPLKTQALCTAQCGHDCCHRGISGSESTDIAFAARRDQVEGQLARLGVAAVDLWVLRSFKEQDTPLEETMAAIKVPLRRLCCLRWQRLQWREARFPSGGGSKAPLRLHSCNNPLNMHAMSGLLPGRQPALCGNASRLAA